MLYVETRDPVQTFMHRWGLASLTLSGPIRAGLARRRGCEPIRVVWAHQGKSQSGGGDAEVSRLALNPFAGGVIRDRAGQGKGFPGEQKELVSCPTLNQGGRGQSGRLTGCNGYHKDWLFQSLRCSGYWLFTYIDSLRSSTTT